MINFEVKIHRSGRGGFQTIYRDPKTGLRKRKRFKILKEAKEYKKHMETLVSTKGCHAFSNLRIAQAVQDYLLKFPESKIRERKNHFLSFIETFGKYKVVSITTNDLQEWMDKNQQRSHLSTLTMNRIKAQFNGFFNYLKREKIIEHNPILDVYFKRFDNPRRKRIVLSIAEVRMILENAKKFSPDILFIYLSCVAHTGARRSEILRLNQGDIDFNTGLIHLKKTKNSHERFVRISPILESVLRKYIKGHHQDALILDNQGKRMHSHTLDRLIVKFKAFFPIENKGDWGSHSLRHSFAYNFLKKGGQMYQLQAVLGHRSIDVTIDTYGQLQAQDVHCPSPYEWEDEELEESKYKDHNKICEMTSSRGKFFIKNNKNRKGVLR